jgi:hypothetical protein
MIVWPRSAADYISFVGRVVACGFRAAGSASVVCVWVDYVFILRILLSATVWQINFVFPTFMHPATKPS